MATEILGASDRLLAAVMNGVYQGSLITVLVALSFRVFSRTNAATRHAVWLCTLVLLVLLLGAHCFFLSRPPALQPGEIARTTATPEQEIGTPNVGAVGATANGMPTETGSSAPKWPGDLPGEQDQRASQKPESLGPVLLQPPPWWRRSSPSPPSQEERVGERRSTLLNAPLPNPLPTRSSREEGENYWWWHRDAPDSLSLTPTEPTYDVQRLSIGSLPPPGAALRGGEANSPSTAVEPLAASTASNHSTSFYTALRRLANRVSLTLGFKSRAARIAGAILLSVCLLLSAARLFMLLWRLRQIRMLKLQSLPASEALNELFRGLVSRLGAGRKVELKTLPTAQSSFVLGFLHPVILLPAEPMEPAEAEPILRHELAHVRRRDDWANLLQHFILAAFPFHPAVWWISRRLSLEREIACDDYVLQSSAHPHAYALLLANLAARMQRCPPLLAPGASNNKTQLQQRIDMILNTRRNTSPRLAAKWLTFMASTAALFAVTALCLAPRIVLAQSAAAPAAENTQDSLIDEPVQATPAVASVAASFSPEAGAAASSDAAPPATPKPPAIGSGPKLKTGGSWAVPGQPAVEPVPPTLSVLTAPAVPAAPAPLTAQSAPLMSQGSFVLSAAPVPEPRPGRTPRLARAESADSTLEERLERLEKMVESLMSRKDAPQNPYLLKPSPEKVGPIDRKEMAELAAEMARRHELEDQIIKEHARREAARAADLTKRAAGDAEKIARAEQKRQTRLKELQLKGITGTPGRRIAVINNLTFTQGEEGEVRARNGRIKIRVLEIRDKSVLLQIEGLAEPKELLLQEGSQKQLDELRKRLEMLDREREKLEREIEQLERNQEQLEEQPEEELDNDVQSDTSEVNSDSIQTPRQ